MVIQLNLVIIILIILINSFVYIKIHHNLTPMIFINNCILPQPSQVQLPRKGQLIESELEDLHVFIQSFFLQIYVNSKRNCIKSTEIISKFYFGYLPYILMVLFNTHPILVYLYFNKYIIFGETR